MPKKIIDEETVWWFAESMKFNPDSMMLQICKSHEALRVETNELKFIIRELHNFISLDPADQTEEERRYLIERTKGFMLALICPTTVLRKGSSKK